MAKYHCCFEDFPNEIIIEICSYLDACETFQSFSNLNHRLHFLIQSFHHLKLAFYFKRTENNPVIHDKLFPSFVYTLIIDSGVDIDLQQFPNIRRLRLEWPSDEQLLQLNSNTPPYLEELNLVYIEALTRNNRSLFLPSLRTVKVRFINLFIYQTLLSSCPNLHSFQLSMFTSEEPLLNIQTHDNLRRLFIKVGDVLWPWNDHLFSNYLSCVPNLEQLNVHRLLYISRITDSFFNYNWLASVITIHLRSFQRFRFYLRSIQSKNANKLHTEKILLRIKESFTNLHNAQSMSEYIFPFEQLPNELIINIFQYFHLGELFRIFYNLNNRLNNLIKSINHLSLIISNENDEQFDCFNRFSSYLYTLILHGYIDMNLCLFNRIRRLILINTSNELIGQLNLGKFDYLEHLSVKCDNPMSTTSDLYKTIFSNGFPRLESYYNLSSGSIRSIEEWTGSAVLRVLKIGYIALVVFKTILSICPNLYYLDFGILIPSESSSNIEPHYNLKHLILRTSNNTCSTHEHVSVLKDLFACLPHLKKLSIHRRDNISIIKMSFIEYDWFSSLINSSFLFLQRFDCYFHIFRLRNGHIEIGPNLKNILGQIIEHFRNVHSNRYQARLIID